MAGMSLQEISDKIGGSLSKQAIARLESGEAKPDSKTVSLLSKALGVPGDYFFRRTMAISLEDVKFRKLKKLPIKEQDRIAALTVDFLERYAELEDMLGIETKPGFKPKGHYVSNFEQVEAAAESFRKLWNFASLQVENLELFQLSQARQKRADIRQ